jgi:CheY-like chemotaxis protein
MRGDRELCLDTGMDDYLTKPIRAPIVRDMVAKWAAPGPFDVEEAAA